MVITVSDAATCFPLASGNDYAIVESQVYDDLLTAAITDSKEQSVSSALLSFRDGVLPQHRSVTLHFTELKKHIPEGAKALVNAGFLLLQGGPDEYRLSIPRVGALVQMLTSGRDEMLRHIRKKPFKEARKDDVDSIKLRKSKLGPRFHLRDLLGRGAVEIIKRPGGELIRVVER